MRKSAVKAAIRTIDGDLLKIILGRTNLVERVTSENFDSLNSKVLRRLKKRAYNMLTWKEKTMLGAK